MRLRVMRVISRLNVGGPSVQASVLHHGLDPERFEQRLYIGDVDPGEAEHCDLRDRSLAVHRVNGLGRSVRPGDDGRALAGLIRHMRQFRPHIVHTHAAKAGALGRVAASLARVPARVHTYHGHLLHGYFGRLGTAGVVAVERLLASRTDHLVAVGERVRDDLLSARIGRLAQYSVVPPGTALMSMPSRATARAELGLQRDTPTVAFVGRLTRIKRPDRLLETMNRVRESIPDAQLIICGGGSLASMASGPGVVPVGWRADVEMVYAASDLVLLTSDNEGVPVSLIEAGLAGVPAVATRVGSIEEVVRDGSTGLLCEPCPRELAAATVRLLSDARLRERMGVAAREWADSRFGAARLVADIDRLYMDLAMSHGWLAAQRRPMECVA